jgi:hypothetical protein
MYFNGENFVVFYSQIHVTSHIKSLEDIIDGLVDDGMACSGR